MPVIRTHSLSKHFGTTRATDGISMHVNRGEIYGCLGLNGAGKTTLIRLLLGMIMPDQGNVMLFERQLTSRFDLWNDIGYLVETPYAYPNLSVAENLKVYYKLRQLKNPVLINKIIDKLKLTRYRDKKAQELSLGNLQRLGLAKALMHEPTLLILDEPINGLDPEGIVEIRELFKVLADQGCTIFISSHILGEISKIAHRIGIIHEGKLLRELTANELTNKLVKKVVVVTHDNVRAVNLLNAQGHKTILTAHDEIEISDEVAIARPENLSRLLVEHNLPPKQVYLSTEDLEMYFLRTIREHTT